MSLWSSLTVVVPPLGVTVTAATSSSLTRTLTFATLVLVVYLPFVSPCVTACVIVTSRRSLALSMSSFTPRTVTVCAPQADGVKVSVTVA